MQPDHDEEVGQMHGMHGTLDTDLEVQRATERAELTALLCLVKRIAGLHHNSLERRYEVRCLQKRRTPIRES